VENKLRDSSTSPDIKHCLETTPKQDGFRMTGEFEPHSKTWMAWPVRTDTWIHEAEPAKRAFTAVARAISEFEPVTMCVAPGHEEEARRFLGEDIEIMSLEYDDAWMRDIGPTFVTNGSETRGVDWNFNSWGGIYDSWEKDQNVASAILHKEGLKRYAPDIVMEGGAIHVDGEGTILTTEECLLNPNRNPFLTKEQAEEILVNFLHAEKVIWLPRGLFNDEVGGHIDEIAAFVEPGVVVLHWTDNPGDPQYDRSREAYEILKREKDAKGRELIVHILHQPDPLFLTTDERDQTNFEERTEGIGGTKQLAASYINFYLPNGGVILPSFEDRVHDRMAYDQFSSLFPNREIVQLSVRDIILGGGGIHCITQQQPSINNYS
jgi:agmatine deiminase